MAKASVLEQLRKRHKAGESLVNELRSICCAKPSDSELRYGQSAIIRFLVKAGVPIADPDQHDVTALHCAVRFRSPGAVRTLIELGADVNAQDKKTESTPLHRAVTSTGAPGTAGMQNEAREIVELLLAGGADAELRNKKGKRAIEYISNPAMLALFGQN